MEWVTRITRVIKPDLEPLVKPVRLGYHLMTFAWLYIHTCREKIENIYIYIEREIER